MIPDEVRIERGSLDNDQVVALVTALAICAPAANGPSTGPGTGAELSLWSKRSRLVRPSVRPGPGAWRASMMPR